VPLDGRAVETVGFVNVKTDYRARATTVRFSSRETRGLDPPLRNQKFADSPLEEGGFEPSVPL
jgi:hypothetical protein